MLNLNLTTQRAAEALLTKPWMIATAESCTGGLIATQLTEIPGSSTWFDRGFVTYSNAAKIELLGVRKETLDLHGAVSPETAIEMAEGALTRSHAHIAVSVTGVAGPSGGSADKPVGLVVFGFAIRAAATQTIVQHFTGNRRDIRAQAAAFALDHIATLAGVSFDHMA